MLLFVSSSFPIHSVIIHPLLAPSFQTQYSLSIAHSIAGWRRESLYPCQSSVLISIGQYFDTILLTSLGSSINRLEVTLTQIVTAMQKKKFNASINNAQLRIRSFYFRLLLCSCFLLAHPSFLFSSFLSSAL